MACILLAGCGGPPKFTFTEKEQKTLTGAIESDLPKPVQDLLDRGMKPDVRDPQGVPYIVRAAEKGYTDVVLTFLNNRADPNSADNEGRTALMVAAERGFSDTADRLLGLGADPKRVTTGGAKPGRSALHFAAENGRLDVMRSLLKRGVDVNTRDGAGRTALDLAEAAEQAQAADLLKNNGGKTGS